MSYYILRICDVCMKITGMFLKKKQFSSIPKKKLNDFPSKVTPDQSENLKRDPKTRVVEGKIVAA